MSTVKIQLRRGTAAQWSAADSVGSGITLSSGEIAVETDTNRIKVGDGQTRWNSLGYADGIPPITNSGFDQVLLSSTIASASADNMTMTVTLTATNPSGFQSSDLQTIGPLLGPNPQILLQNNNPLPEYMIVDLQPPMVELNQSNQLVFYASGFGPGSANSVSNPEFSIYVDGSNGLFLSNNGTFPVWQNIDVQSPVSQHNSQTTNVHGIADTSLLVTENGTQTLTNKTLTSPIIDGGTLSRSVLLSIEERANIVAASATGTINFDALTSTIWYYTSNAGANFTLNFRGNSSTTLNSILSVGDSITLVFMNTNGATPFYPTAYQIDGTNVTPRWQGGVAPTSGNANSVDVYSVAIIKTSAAPTYLVLAGQGRFA